ncbi:MAG: TIGR02996 domain-containing protein [Deltaproteobacteria bacterium]|nr:TIGR02996 domain-containing protein [Deltaproteobacteria bacterium]
MDEAALLEAIRDAPDDDAPRLVYADALLLRNDPWGEIIVVSCEIARRERERRPYDADARALWNRLGELRAARFPEARLWHDFERGFCVGLDTSELDIASATGVEYMFVREAKQANATRERLDALAAWPLLPQLERLRLEARREEGRVGSAVPPIVERATSLVALDLMEMDLARADVEAIFALPHAAQLQRFALMANVLLEGGLAGLRWPRLDELDLGACRLTSDHVEELFETDALHGLVDFELSYNGIDDRAAAAIARRPLDRLRVLKLQGTAIGPSGIQALAGAPALAGLETLAIGGWETDLDDVLPSLATAFPALVELHFESNFPVRRLAAIARPLHKLSLDVAEVDPAALAALLAHPAVRALRELWLDVGEDAAGLEIAATLAAADLPSLERLGVRCKMGPLGARALARAPHLPATLSLMLYGDDAEDAADDLRARFANVDL